MGANPSISVAVCTKDHPSSLTRCLRSLDPIRAELLEVLVIDNNSKTAATRQIAQEFGVKYFLEEAPGPCAARNHALWSATGEVLAFIDDDCEVIPGWLGAVADGFGEPGVGCVTGPTVCRPDANWIQRSFAEYSHQFPEKPYQVCSKDVMELYHRAAAGIGANMAFRRSVLIGLGGFPVVLSSTCGGFDDDYMFYRVVDSGFKLHYTPAARVYQEHRTSLGAQMSRNFEYRRL